MSRAAKPRSSGRVWILMILGLISINVVIVGVTVYFALSDKSVAVEPDYYAKAVRFDQTMRQREASAKLGWSADPSLRPSPDGRSMQLAIAITNRGGQPVEGALVQAEAFASARAARRQELTLAPAADQPGVYLADVIIDRPGLWRIRIAVRRGEEFFVRDTDLIVPDLLR